VWISASTLVNKPVLIPVGIGAMAPSIMGIIFTYISKDKEGIKDFWRRVINFRLITGKWYAAILLIYPLAMALAVGLDIGFGGTPPSFYGASQTLTHPLVLLGFIVTMIIGGPLAEELGWRGYALEHLQTKWNALVASLILGFIQLLWHIPLFFIQGTSQASEGLGSVIFLMLCVQAFEHAVIFNWIFNNTNGSILSVILVHFIYNFTFTLLAQIGNALSARLELFFTITLGVVTIFIVMFWGPKTFTRERAREFLKKLA
jgi:membrane protease YdiL (CAAX protease family)